MSLDASPDSSNRPGPDTRDVEQDRIALLKGIVVSWEKLRLIYNGILLFPGLGVCAAYYREGLWRVAEGYVTRFQLLIEAGIGALLFGLAANVCYCLGPYAECVTAAAGFPVTGRKIRPFLFGIGLLFSLFPIVVLVMSDAL